MLTLKSGSATRFCSDRSPRPPSAHPRRQCRCRECRLLGFLIQARVDHRREVRIRKLIRQFLRLAKSDLALDRIPESGPMPS